MELLSSKIVAMVLMGALALFFGLLPLKVKPMILKGDENSRRRRKRERIVSALLCFGSGVLIATVFIHMLPETREGFEKSKQLGLLGKTDHEAQASHIHEHHVEPQGTLHSKNSKNETPLTNNHSSHSHSGLTLHEKEGRAHQNIAEHNHKDTPRDHIGMDTHKNLSYHSHEHNDNSSHGHEIYFHRDGNIPHRLTEPVVRPNKNEHHDHEALGNHEHDAHDNHEHDARDNHEHDAHDNHEHDANGNHEHDAHGNHEHDAHTNHEHGTHDNHDHDPHIDNHTHGALDIHESHNNGSNIHNESESNLREKNKFHSENDNWKSAENANGSNGKNANENNSDRQTGIPIVNKNKNNTSASAKIEIEPIHEKEKDGIRKPTPVQPLLIPALTQPLPEPTAIKPVVTSNRNVKNVSEEPTKETSKLTNTNPPKIIQNDHNSPLLKASEPEKVQAVSPLIKTKNVDSGTPSKEFPSDAVKENEQRIDTHDPKHPEHHHHYGDNGEPHFEALSQNSEPSHKGDDAHDHKDDSHGYPLAELMICVGFFLIYLIEEMIHKALFKHPEEPYEKKDLVNGSGIDAEENHVSHAHNHSHVPPFHSHSPAVGNGHIPRKCKDTQIPNGHTVMENSYPMETQHSYQKNMAPVSEWGAQGVDNPVFAGDIDATSWNPKIKNSILSNGQISPMPLNDLSKSSTTSSTDGSTVLSLPLETISSSPPEKVPLKTVVLSNLRSLLVVIALSFHAVFEGMAVGLQEYSQDVWYLFLAIAAHKFVILFCIGLELMVAGTPLVLMVLYMVILAVVTPFGIAIGIVVTENSAIGGSEHLLVVTILQGLAGGTLLYVAFLEVLERERSKPGGRILKFFCLVIGFACMASVEAIMGGHSH